MAVPHENWSISNLKISDQARVHVGHLNEYHDHRYYGDESQLSPAERQRAREDAILSSLYFTDMSVRERAIDSPYGDTFGWIFDAQVTERESYYEEDVCNLMSRWLEHEHGIFFIVGKAGSGKSTLMRFLAEHKQTSTLLHIWARRQDCALTICAHYFWCSGSELQSSQEGLWRSILYAIAKKDRKLASAMFTDRACDDGQTLAHLRKQPWARNDLISVLPLLVAQLEVQKVAVCLFIDGLDEYQGDEMMLIEELRVLLGSPYIKICASSRPRNLFEEAFGYEECQWKLALHLLTRGDMAQLARTRLYEDNAFCKLVDRGDRTQDFVTVITDKSQGVFLWTVLVVKELIREAHQAGTIDELKERLDALPIEIGGEKGLYQRIVDRSDPRYRKYMARLLLVMLEPREPRDYDLMNRLRWADVHFLYYDDKDPAFATQRCLELDDKYRLAWYKEAEEAAVQPFKIRGHDTSCRGLFLACHERLSGFHPHGVNCQVHYTSLNEDTKRQVRKWCPDFVDAKDTLPMFSHRSVRDYLTLPKIRERLTDLAGRGFDPALTRCCLRLAQSRLQSSSQYLFELTFLKMIACLDLERRDFVRTILPKFKRIQDTKWRFLPVEAKKGCLLDSCWTGLSSTLWFGDYRLCGDFETSGSSQAHAWFLSLVAREGMVWYCRERWTQVAPSDRQATGTIIIALLLFDKGQRANLARSREQASRDQADLVQYLLRSGVDPNTKYTWIERGFMGGNARQAKASLWEAYVEAFPEVWKGVETDISWVLEVMQLLLHDGHADRKCCLPKGKESLLSALAFVPHRDAWTLQSRRWREFAGQLHALLDAHGLLTREERHVGRRQGWLPTKLKAPRPPQTTPKQSATEPDARPFSRWLRKLVG